MYEMVLGEHISAIVLKRWPFNHHCGIWEKHEPDESGRQYRILLNKTRGIRCGKMTLIHELVHICDDLNEVERSNGATEDKALGFYENNRGFVDYLWRRYVNN